MQEEGRKERGQEVRSGGKEANNKLNSGEFIHGRK